MDDRNPHPTFDAADLVRFSLALTLAAFALPEAASQLREATLAWATAAELFRLVSDLAAPHEHGAALAAMDACHAMHASDVDQAVARLAALDGAAPDAWLAAVSARQDAPTCERCALPIALVEPGPVGEALALADGAVRSGDAWVCPDCLAAHPALAAVYAPTVRTTAEASAVTRAA